MIVIAFRCPHCRRALRAPADWVRPRVRCPGCHVAFRIPATGTLTFSVAEVPTRWGQRYQPSRN